MNTLDTRRMAAKLLVGVILGKITVLGALKSFPKDCDDPSVNACFFILMHFEADEDIRKKDPLYKQTQYDFIIEAAQTLAKGGELPVNVIEEYKNYYKQTGLYKKMTKKNIIKRLLKPINL